MTVKKKFLLLFMTSALLCPPVAHAPKVMAASDSSIESNGYVVAIDPGHQAWDIDMSGLEPLGPGSTEQKAKATSGTCGVFSGLPEYELNLDVSLLLGDLLEERGYTVVLTREDNETAISNAERAQLATDNNADIYVRIHANGEDSHTASGALTMVPSSSNPYVGDLSEESQRLGQCILDSYCEATGFDSLGVQFYDNMTGINWSTVPVTILEMGFMTNEADDLLMADPKFQETMAEGIAGGIDAYFSSEASSS
jgi:N-acetylmuramoyl-L-alanine amidase